MAEALKFLVISQSKRRLGSFEAWRARREDVLRARQELQERKPIGRARLRLMKTRKLSEETTYQALRREAMAQRKRLTDVAWQVVDTIKA